jgi:hypothetical protein
MVESVEVMRNGDDVECFVAREILSWVFESVTDSILGIQGFMGVRVKVKVRTKTTK